MIQFLLLTFLFVQLVATKNVYIGPSCSPDWLSFNGSCFKVFLNDPISMQMARQTCYDSETELASIHSAEENEFVKDAISRLISQNGSSSSSVGAFYIGLFVSRRFDFSQLPPELLWADGSPVDFFDGPDDSLDDHNWSDGHFLWPKKEKARNISSTGNCMVIGIGIGGKKSWMDTRCDMPAQGFVCKTVVPKSSPNLVYVILMPSFCVLSLCSQCYVIWLIMAKSPEMMKNYRFYLCGNTIFDAIASFAFGILLIPDIWQPYALAASVNGLAKYLGTEGGRISFCITEFAVIGQALFQLLSGLFRYASLMERQQLRIYRLMTNPRWSALGQTGVVCVVAAVLVVVTFRVMDNPTDLHNSYMWPLYNGVSQKLYSDALLARQPVITLNPFNLLQTIAICSAAFCLCYSLAIFVTIRIVLYLRANVKKFSKRTFQLQLQLIMSLMVQLILPFVSIGFPVLAVLILSLLALPISKSTAQFGIFLFELYALLNPLSVVIFVSPFRRHTARIFGIHALQKKLFSSAPESSYSGGNQMQTTIVPEQLNLGPGLPEGGQKELQKSNIFRIGGRVQSAATTVSTVPSRKGSEPIRRQEPKGIIGSGRSQQQRSMSMGGILRESTRF